MNKRTSATPLILAGILIIILSNPLLYLTVATIMVDVQNLFGAGIDRQSVSFETNDPFIQGMGIVAVLGLVPLGLGLWKRWKQN